MNTLLTDIKLALRGFRRQPGFFMTAVLTLAVGMGAGTAVFSIVRSVLIEPLPYPNPERLVTIGSSPWMPTEIFLDFQNSGSLESLAGFVPRQFAVSGVEVARQVEGVQTTPDFLAILGARTALGRTFTPVDAHPASPRTALISYASWQQNWGGSADVLGQTLLLNGQPHEIIGVLEGGFRQLTPRVSAPEVWTPLEIEPTEPDGTDHWVIPLGRLAADASLGQARSELEAVVGRFRRRHPEAPRSRWDFRLETVHSELTREVRPALTVLQAAVLAVLLISCLNVSNLLLARLRTRQRDVAVRSALGASKGRLARQLMTESLMIWLAGGVVGFGLLSAGLESVVAAAPQDISRLQNAQADLGLFGVTLLLSLAAGLLFGTLPVMAALRGRLAGYLKEAGRSSDGLPARHHLSGTLVVAEVTLTLVLLVSAGLLVRSFVSLIAQPTGFRSDGVLVLQMRVPEHHFEDVGQLDGFYQRLLGRLGQMAGVEAVGLANNLPSRQANANREILIEGQSQPRQADYAVVSPDYFRCLEIPLLRGRLFQESDRQGSLPVALVDESLRRQLWPGQDPIGERLQYADVRRTVVGVVADIRGGGFSSDPRPGFYIPYQQRPHTPVELVVGRSSVFLIRSRAEAAALAEPLRRAIREVDPGQPVPEVAELSSILAQEVRPQRFRTLVLGAFAAVSLLLSLAGIYGVVAYLVAERTQEFGVRMALGATRRDILRRVLSWGFRLGGLGVLAGLAGSAAVTRLLAGLLFHVRPMDPLTLLGSVLAIVLATLAACLIPACKAARTDPIIALRAE